MNETNKTIDSKITKLYENVDSKINVVDSTIVDLENGINECLTGDFFWDQNKILCRTSHEGLKFLIFERIMEESPHYVRV